MKRLSLLLAVTSLAGSLALGHVADARDSGRGRDDGREQKTDRGGKRTAKPGDDRIRPGGYLSPAFRGQMILDYQRFRLRPPPRGFAWYQYGQTFLLVSLSDGQVFDVVE
jgi:Ni/Co efflux regulator RcnB